MICRRYRVDGRVQGVGFRAATVIAARRLHVTGWVRNSPDGRVEVLACAEEETLRKFERWLHEGPTGARVDSLIAADAEPQSFADFRVTS